VPDTLSGAMQSITIALARLIVDVLVGETGRQSYTKSPDDEDKYSRRQGIALQLLSTLGITYVARSLHVNHPID